MDNRDFEKCLNLDSKDWKITVKKGQKAGYPRICLSQSAQRMLKATKHIWCRSNLSLWAHFDQVKNLASVTALLAPDPPKFSFVWNESSQWHLFSLFDFWTYVLLTWCWIVCIELSFCHLARALFYIIIKITCMVHLRWIYFVYIQKWSILAPF